MSADLPPLEACSFCSSPGKLTHPMGSWVSREEGYGPDGSRVVCSNDDCPGTRTHYGIEQDAEAITAWNTRMVQQHSRAVEDARSGLIAVIEESQMAAIYDGDPADSRALSSHHRAFVLKRLAVADFIGEHWPVIVAALANARSEPRSSRDPYAHADGSRECRPEPRS